MHVGMAAIFQNPGGARPDAEVYRQDVRLADLADLAEPLGFESIWSVEHHFTDYTMCPDVLQFLSYMAGRTEHVKLGSMVVVLPWHDPMRVAEQVAVLDTLSGGRMILGLGRGAGRVEFEGFRTAMDESRGRFVESAEMLLRGLEQGWCEYEGEFVHQPRADIRPAPAASFRGRTYAAAVSPESARIMAELGVGLLVIPQKPWSEVERELEDYRGIYREVNGAEPPPPITAGWTLCAEDPDDARDRARRWIGGYWASVLAHYEFAGDHLRRTRGYEYYARFSEKIREYGAEGAIDFFLGLQVWGTPEQCYEKVLAIRERTGADSFVGVFSYAGMPEAEAEANMTLFAREVLPELQRVGSPALTA